MILEIPGKTYLCGEYAILIGAPALLLAHGPMFRLHCLEKKNAAPEADSARFHEQSPAGRFFAAHENLFRAFDFQWEDPHEGRGGFGASGAQFLGLWALAQKLEGRDLDPQRMLRDFKRHDSSHSSGGDVLCQLMGGVTEVDVRSAFFCSTHDWPFEEFFPLVVSTGKKIATHDHLKELDLSRLKILEEPVRRACDSFKKSAAEVFLRAVQEFQNRLEELNLVAPSSRVLLEKFKVLPGFLGAKSCGALGADTILIFTRTESVEEALQRLGREGFRALRGDTVSGLKVKNDL